MEIIQNQFRSSWDDNEETKPDAIDLQMLK